jgi:hypothetical protein
VIRLIPFSWAGPALMNINPLHCKKRPACDNVVENRPEQNFAAHIVPAWLLINNIVQAVHAMLNNIVN